MVNINDIKNGMTIIYDGKLCMVQSFQHVKPGKGAAFMKVKLRNLKTGSITEETINSSVKVEKAHVDKKAMVYLYNSGTGYVFMDNETYEQTPLNKDQLGDALNFLKENMNVKLCSFKGNVFSVELPISVDLEVKYTEPGFAGNTTTTSGKPATLENGYEVQVPLFVNIGDIVRIDTRTGKYMERV